MPGPLFCMQIQDTSPQVLWHPESGDERVLTTVNCPGQGLGSEVEGWRGKGWGRRERRSTPPQPTQPGLYVSSSAGLGAVHQDGEGKRLPGRTEHGGCACQNDFSKLRQRLPHNCSLRLHLQLWSSLIPAHPPCLRCKNRSLARHLTYLSGLQHKRAGLCVFWGFFLPS